jgi:hypothetical protein
MVLLWSFKEEIQSSRISMPRMNIETPRTRTVPWSKIILFTPTIPAQSDPVIEPATCAV